MSKISFAEFEQYVDIEDRLWNMGREFFNEVQQHYPQTLAVNAKLCHYDDVYVDGTDTLEIGYEAFYGGNYELFMLEVPVLDFLNDHIAAASMCASVEQNEPDEKDVFEQLKKMNEEIDNEFNDFEY